MSTQNAGLIKFIEEAKDLLKPQSIVWIDGSEEQLNALRQEAIQTGEITALNSELMPDCYYHRTAENDVARVEDRTYICTSEQRDAGANNNWMAPEKAYQLTREIMQGSMEGRTMYIIPFSMGVVGSPFAKIGIEVTDSIYVVLNMAIMTRIGQKVVDALGDSDDFVRALHSKCTIDAENRYIMHFPEDNTIISCNSGYGGNVLLGKKCFALRIASYQAKMEGWLAEHMLILGIENPQGEVKYVAGAFPSACGKTNLAMLIPPEIYKQKGYKIWTVGDDIAWIKIGEDGRLYAMNAESGFFGVAPGTNESSNYNALATTQKGTIFTNVAYLPESGDVWWEKLTKTPPNEPIIDWKGRPWSADSKEKAAHPNSRFTAPAANCPCISPEWENPQGVPLDAIIFGGRRAKTAPLIYEAFDWEHGVFVGSIMASETTAAATGQTGVVRRDPMAMLPFCGYNMGDYFAHWLTMGQKTDKLPKIFNVNWFRLDDDGNFIWPGYGDNFRILEWILRRCDEEVNAQETEIGYVPFAQDINLDGLDYQISESKKFDLEVLKSILNVEKDYWLDDVENIRQFYAKIGESIPEKLQTHLTVLEQKLQK